MPNKERVIEPHDKSDWKKLDQEEVFENRLEGDWVQKGPYLINKSGRLDYAVYVGIDKRLVGVDDSGKPVLESV